jgi:voltage-gated potassium channel
MLRVTEQTLRMEEVNLDAESPLVGRTLREASIRARTGLLVVALRSRDGAYHFNPEPETCLKADDILIVIGTPEQLATLRLSQ